MLKRDDVEKMLCGELGPVEDINGDYDSGMITDVLNKLLADRPAPSGEARCYHCDEPIASGKGVHLIASIHGIGASLHASCAAQTGVCHPAACRDEMLWRKAIEEAVAAERNRARREALEQAAEVIANEIRLRENESLGYDHMRPIDELEADIRALAADPQETEKKA